MKKISLILLGLLLVLCVSCSTESSFLSKVKGKTVTFTTEVNSSSTGQFTSSGKEFNVGSASYTFDNAISELSATYKDSNGTELIIVAGDTDISFSGALSASGTLAKN